jgi:hypothetical protein
MMTLATAKRSAGRRGWLLVALAMVLSSCALNTQGPWVDEFGRRMQGTEMVEFRGFAACNQTQVTFIRFFEDQYAKDPTGVLGQLESPTTEEPISFEVLPELPDGLDGTDITHAGREVYIGEDRSDYLYIRLPNGEVERWPRAEVTCVREE